MPSIGSNNMELAFGQVTRIVYFLILLSNNFYCPCSEASEGYVFTGICLSNLGGGEVDNTKGQPPPPARVRGQPPPSPPGQSQRCPPGWDRSLTSPPPPPSSNHTGTTVNGRAVRIPTGMHSCSLFLGSIFHFTTNDQF